MHNSAIYVRFEAPNSRSILFMSLTELQANFLEEERIFKESIKTNAFLEMSKFIRENDFESTKKIFDLNIFNIDERIDIGGYKMLLSESIIASDFSIEAIKFLVNLGANLNLINPISNAPIWQTPIILKKNNKIEFLKFIKEQGINLCEANPSDKGIGLFLPIALLTNVEFSELGIKDPKDFLVNCHLEARPYLKKETLLEIANTSQPNSAGNWIAHKTFISNTFEKPEILDLFSKVYTHKFINLILKIAALEFIEGKHFLLFFDKDHAKNDMKAGVEGYASQPQGVTGLALTAVAEHPLNLSPSRLIHELTHQAMRIVFQNENKPYYTDNSAKESYDEAIMGTLKNLHQHICEWTLNIHKTCINPDISSWEIGQLINQETVPIIGIEFNQLVWLPFLIINRYIGNVEQSYQINLAQLRESGALNYLKGKAAFIRLYGGGYESDDEHTEFIAFYAEALSRDIPNDMEWVFQPFNDYIETQLIPEMTKYLNDHPLSNLIND